jgi:hypothetical protein
MIIFRCSCNYFSSEIGFPVCYYPIIHSFPTLLSLRLAELGSLEAFHYSSNNSKEISCSLCCTFLSVLSFLCLSLSLSLSLSLLFPLHVCFEYVCVRVSVVCVVCCCLSILSSFSSLSGHWSLSQARRRCKILRSSPSLVSKF